MRQSVIWDNFQALLVRCLIKAFNSWEGQDYKACSKLQKDKKVTKEKEKKYKNYNYFSGSSSWQDFGKLLHNFFISLVVVCPEIGLKLVV